MDLTSILERMSQYIYVFSGYCENGLCSCERYDVQQATWKEIQNIAKPRSKFSVGSTVSGHILVMGGKFSDGTRTNLIELYNPEESKWLPCNFLLSKAKSSFASLSTASGIYICGGSDGHILRSFEQLDPLTGKWTALASLKQKREEHGFTVGPDGKFYSIGGFNGKSCLASAERYDPITGTWEELAPLNMPRRSVCAVSLADGVYALGGYNGEKYLNSVEKYDSNTNQWVEVKSMNHARCTMAAVGSSDCRHIYAIGGYEGSPLNLVERYDVVKDCWEFVTPMKNKRFMHGAILSSLTANSK